MDPLQNRTFWHVKYQISTKFSPTLTDYCGWAVHVHAFIFTGWTVREGRVRTGNIQSISLMVGLQGWRSKICKNFRIFNFGIQLWLTRIRSDLITADRPIILESTLNDLALYLSRLEIWPFDGPPTGTFYVKYQHEILPKVDRLLWMSCACPCLHIYRVDR